MNEFGTYYKLEEGDFICRVVEGKVYGGLMLINSDILHHDNKLNKNVPVGDFCGFVYKNGSFYSRKSVITNAVRKNIDMFLNLDNIRTIDIFFKGYDYPTQFVNYDYARTCDYETKVYTPYDDNEYSEIEDVQVYYKNKHCEFKIEEFGDHIFAVNSINIFLNKQKGPYIGIYLRDYKLSSLFEEPSIMQ